MLTHSQSTNCFRSVYSVMALPLDRETTITIAVDLLMHKSSRLVQALKDLLTFVPNPIYTKDVLEAAVTKLIYTCPASTL